MRKISTENLKKIELEMLIYLDQLCKKENLRYYICGGTLLGAVRHKGFIPWDDDIDVVMPRPDYQKLIDQWKDDERYRLLSERDRGYYYNFAKLVDKRTTLKELKEKPLEGLGVYLDIFPLDGMPEEESARMEHFQELDRLRHQVTVFSRFPHFRKNVFCILQDTGIWLVNMCKSLPDAQKRLLDAALQYPYDESKYIYSPGGAYGAKDIFPQSWFEGTVPLEFEGAMVEAPAEYEKYLRQLYGDYMQLPPEAERVSHHRFIAQYK